MEILTLIGIIIAVVVLFSLGRIATGVLKVALFLLLGILVAVLLLKISYTDAVNYLTAMMSKWMVGYRDYGK